MNYAYMNDAGAVHWLELPLMDEAPPLVLSVEGVSHTRSYRAERAGVPATKGWPMTCVASGVNAADAQKLRDEFDRIGVPTEVTADGDPIYRNKTHRSAALKGRGLYDRDSFYD